MLSILNFKFKHLPHLLDMHKSQAYADITQINMKTLPKIGYIAFLNDQPVAAGFLRRLEPCFAQLDTLVSNAYFGSQIRHEGVTLVVDNLFLEAKRLNLKGLLALTSDAGVLKRAETLGFHIVQQNVVAISL